MTGSEDEPGEADTLTHAGATAVTIQLGEISSALRQHLVCALPN
jgi:hypothetical protein